MRKNKIKITCKNCKTDFIPDRNQRKFIKSSREKNMTFIMLDCPNCDMSFDFNPTDNSDNVEHELPLRTPISGSHGFISYIEDNESDFFGCGETGAIWKQEKNLFNDIDLIIKKYPHREKCYLKTKNGWIANPDEPENMDDLIDKEDVENLDKYERD